MTTPTERTSYYDRAYRDYRRQNPNRKLDHYIDTISRYSPQPASLLDIGCGLGAFLRRARQRHPAWKLTGTDIDPDAVRQVANLVPDAVVRRASAHDPIFTPESFDVVTAWDVLEHIDDVASTRSVIRSVLKPDGLFVFVVPVYDGLTGPIVQLLDKDETHVHRRGRWFWLDWASEEFEILSWHGVFRYLLGNRWYIHHPTNLMRRHSPAILVTARKP